MNSAQTSRKAPLNLFGKYVDIHKNKKEVAALRKFLFTQYKHEIVSIILSFLLI